jgi:hypothetical protein
MSISTGLWRCVLHSSFLPLTDLSSAAWPTSADPHISPVTPVERQIFTPDPETVEPLPSSEVLVHLQTVSPRAAIAFLEFLIYKLDDQSSQYHDRLAELYIEDVKRERKKGSSSNPYFVGSKECCMAERWPAFWIAVDCSAAL